VGRAESIDSNQYTTPGELRQVPACPAPYRAAPDGTRQQMCCWRYDCPRCGNRRLSRDRARLTAFAARHPRAAALTIRDRAGMLATRDRVTAFARALRAVCEVDYIAVFVYAPNGGNPHAHVMCAPKMPANFDDFYAALANIASAPKNASSTPYFAIADNPHAYALYMARNLSDCRAVTYPYRMRRVTSSVGTIYRANTTPAAPATPAQQRGTQLGVVRAAPTVSARAPARRACPRPPRVPPPAARAPARRACPRPHLIRPPPQLLTEGIKITEIGAL
jgi:hypothetical protein